MTRKQGETVRQDIVVVDENDDPINLTDAEIYYKLYKEDETRLVLTEEDDEILIEDAANGLVRVDLSSEITEQLSKTFTLEIMVVDRNDNTYIEKRLISFEPTKVWQLKNGS